MTTARRAVAIHAVETYVVLAIYFATSLVIARVLTPSQIGVFAVAMVVVSIARTVRDFGIFSYLIKEEHLTPEKIRAASAVSFTISWLLALLIFIASFPVAAFYQDPRLLRLLWIMALTFVLIPFGSVVFALLRRDFRVTAIFVSRIVGVCCWAVTAITLALAGFGEVSLAWSVVVDQLVVAAAAAFVRPRGMPFWPSFRNTRKLVGFSVQSIASDIARDFGTTAPDAVLGKVQDMAAVALFSRAMGLVDLVARLIADTVWSVTLPYFARIKREGGNVGAALSRTQVYITGMAWPFFAVLAFSAEPVILTLYGSQWGGSVVVAKILCAFGALTCTTSFATTAMIAADRMAQAMRVTLSVNAVRIAITIASAPFGLIPLSAAMIVAGLSEFLLVMSASRTTLAVDLLGLAKDYARSAFLSALSALPAVAFVLAGAMEKMSLVGLLVLATASIACWAIALFVVRHPLCSELRAVVLRGS